MQHPFNTLGLDAMFLLNLERRPERRKYADEQFKSIGLTGVKHWPAVDATALGLRSIVKDITPGMIGCYRSHRDIMKHCLDNNINSYIVFEDDPVFIGGFNHFIALAIENIPPDWEFIYWGCHEHKNGQPLKFINEYWAIPCSVWGTQCFMIRNRQTIQKIYDGLEQMIMQIDCQLSQMVLRDKKINHYAVQPCAVWQKTELESDVQEPNKQALK